MIYMLYVLYQAAYQRGYYSVDACAWVTSAWGMEEVMIVEATRKEFEAGLKCMAAVIGGIPQTPVLPANLRFGGQSINVQDLCTLQQILANALYATTVVPKEQVPEV